MSSLGIGLDAYKGVGGMTAEHLSMASGVDIQAVNELLKAMAAGDLSGGSYVGQGPSSGGGLKKESLESTLKIITTQEEDMRFWKMIPKKPAFSTVEEYIKKTSIGNFRGGTFTEGGTPRASISAYNREAEKIKYVGTLREVTDVMKAVNIAGINDIVQEITEDGILWVMRKNNILMFFGDAALVPTEFNGIYAQHMNKSGYSTFATYMASDLVYDLRGNTLKPSDVEKANLRLQKRFAFANLLIGPPAVFTDYAIQYYAQGRFMIGGQANVTALESGGHLEMHRAQNGAKIKLEYDLYAAHYVGRLYNQIAAEPEAPAAPVSVSAVVATADASSKFSDGAGIYYYGVSAVNGDGESIITQIGTTATVTNADDAVDLTFTAGSGSYAATAFTIYRSLVNPADTFANTILYPIMTIPAAGTDALRGSLAAGVDGGAAGKVRDRNRFIPNTEECALMSYQDSTLNYKQLMPLHKHPLADVSTSSRWLTLLYGSLFLYKPEFMIRFINVGTTSDVTA